MKIKDYKCSCGSDQFFFANNGNQKGIYCSYCGKWLKWADKNERNLAITDKNVKHYLTRFVAICEQELSWVFFDDHGNETDEHKKFINIFDRIVKEEERGDK